jgi:2-dehydropantoate 2-reductase
MHQHASRFVVVGPGAIGGATAALLARAGNDVTLVCKDPALAARVTKEGLRIRGARGDASVRMPAVAAVESLTGEFDYALIAVKAPDLPDAARRLLPFLRPDSLVVSMQNGICVDALAGVVGAVRTVGCVVGWGSTMLAPGDINVTSTGELLIGTAAGDDDARLQTLQKALDSVAATLIVKDIFCHLYSKLIINSCITSVGALCGLPMGRMLVRRDARSLFVAIMREAIQVADALGLDVPPYAGRLDYYSFLRGSSPLAALRRSLLLRLIGFKYRHLRSSSLQSLERGRKTEIDYFNGYIARRGKETGVPTPVNSAIVAQVKEIEAGTRTVSVKNLAGVDITPVIPVPSQA